MEEPLFEASLDDYAYSNYDGSINVNIDGMWSDITRFFVEEQPAAYADEYGIDEILANDEYFCFNEATYSPRNKQWDMMRSDGLMKNWWRKLGILMPSKPPLVSIREQITENLLKILKNY